DAERRRSDIAHVVSEQPQRRQEDRYPLQRVELHAKDALEFGRTGDGRRGQAELAPRPRYAQAGVKVEQYRQERDECGVVPHGPAAPRLTLASPHLAREGGTCRAAIVASRPSRHNRPHTIGTSEPCRRRLTISPVRPSSSPARGAASAAPPR